jgi:hypothetical protein
VERHLAFALVAYKDIAGHQDYWDIAPGYMLLRVEFVAPLEGMVYAQIAEMHPESHPVPIFCYPVGPVEGKRIVLLVQVDYLDDNMVRLASIILF